MKGILFIEPLYHRTIAGNKTMTRRSGGLKAINKEPAAWNIASNGHYIGPNKVTSVLFIKKNIQPGCLTDEDTVVLKPRYKIGEVLFLKEPYKTVDPPVYIEYAFDKPNRTYKSGYVSDFKGLGYENKLFMPADFGREFIRITGIKCERLLDISDEDCIAEGCGTAGFIVDEKYKPFGYIDYLMRPDAGNGYDFCDNTPLQSFISLYKLANKMAKFGSSVPHDSLPKEIDVPNIWVWAYTFEYLKDYKTTPQ